MPPHDAERTGPIEDWAVEEHLGRYKCKRLTFRDAKQKKCTVQQYRSEPHLLRCGCWEDRMFLSREDARCLAEVLTRFAETGQL